MTQPSETAGSPRRLAARRVDAVVTTRTPPAPVHTLPDLLGSGLELVFVGINPSLYSVAQGHYFARKANRFWPCLSRSVLSLRLRQALGVDVLLPEHDRLLPEHGIGFTDVVKRPTANASELSRDEFTDGAAALLTRLEQGKPRVVCFQGMMGYRPVAAVLGLATRELTLGPQPHGLGATQVFVVPSPSPANAHFTPLQQVEWYDRLAAYLAAGHPAAAETAAGQATPTAL